MAVYWAGGVGAVKRITCPGRNDTANVFSMQVCECDYDRDFRAARRAGIVRSLNGRTNVSASEVRVCVYV